MSSCILFNTTDVNQSAFAAALCMSDFSAIGYIKNNETVIEEAIKKLPDTVKTMYTLPDIDLGTDQETGVELKEFIYISSTDDSVKIKVVRIDNYVELAINHMVPANILTFIQKCLGASAFVWEGMLEDPSIKPFDSYYDTFLRLFTKSDFTIFTVQKYLEYANIKVNMINTCASAMQGISLGEYTYYRASNFVHARILKDLEENPEANVAIFADNTGFTNGSEPIMLVFAFGPALPEYVDTYSLKFDEVHDPATHRLSKKIEIPMKLWPKIFCDSKTIDIKKTKNTEITPKSSDL